MAFGAVGESFRRATGGAAAAGGSLMLSPGNIELLVAKLSRMRGAALKLGQMISIQGRNSVGHLDDRTGLISNRHEDAATGDSPSTPARTG
jgi:hypothetical protein